MDRYKLIKVKDSYFVEKNSDQYAQFSGKKNVEHFLTLLVNSTEHGPAVYVQDEVEPQSSGETIIYDNVSKIVFIMTKS